MASTIYKYDDGKAPISQVEFYSNSFGRADAVIYPSDTADTNKLAELSNQLKTRNITAYPDIRDGQQVMIAYGFKKPERLLSVLRREELLDPNAKPDISTNKAKGEADKTATQKFIQRFAIRLAAVSGLLGHISMGTISAITEDWKFFGTAYKYTAADAVIATYGTDKNVTADPVMQDFKDYLWKQGIDNSFVKARTDKISGKEGFDKFMKKRSFQIANAFGAMGNLNQIQIGLKDNNAGFVVAGVTSMFGAGLQIFGSEKKENPQQMKRKGLLSKAFSFIDANPMKIAATTNFTDPFSFFYSAFYSDKIDAKNKAANDAELARNYAHLGNSSLKTHDSFANKGTLFPYSNKGNFAAASKAASALEAEYKKKTTLKNKFFDRFSQDTADKLQAEFETKYKTLAGENGLNSKGELIDNAGEKFKSEDVKKAAKSITRIEELQESNKIIEAGKKWKRPLLFLVATFYTGATLLRFIAKKTAGAEENKDAFNEVYAAAAESLLNIEDPARREEMTLQMGHYLSTHEKMGETSETIINKLRERVETFTNNPFISLENKPVIAQQEDIKPITEHADIEKEVSTNTKTRTSWSNKETQAGFDSREAMVEANRKKETEFSSQFNNI